MEEESKRKRLEAESVLGEDVPGERPRKAVKSGHHAEEDQEDDGDMMAWLTLDDDAVTELSKLLDPAETSPQAVRVKFIDDPYSSSMVFQSSSGYITINGNEESCGSSFSDSDSSVMASVDKPRSAVANGAAFGTFARLFDVRSCGAWGPEADEARGWVEQNGDVGSLLVKGREGDSGSGTYADDVAADAEMWVKFLGEDSFGSQ